jgi:hypothetical protein
LKLEQLEFDLKVVAFTDVSGFELRFADVDRLLKPFQILERKLERRFRQQYADELLANVERQRALGIGDLSARDCGRIAGCLQSPLALVTALEEVRDPDIELLSLIQILAREVLWAKEWDELSIHPERWIGTQIRSDLLRLILKDLGSSCLEGVVVSQGQVDGLIESDARRSLSTTCARQ